MKSTPRGNGESSGPPSGRQGRGDPKSSGDARTGTGRRPDPQVRALLDSGFDPRVILRPVRDKAGRIRDFVFAAVNNEACDYNHLPRAEMLGHRLLELFPNTKSADLFRMCCRALETRKPLELRDFPYPHDLHGQTRVLHFRAHPADDDLCVVWRDVTGQPPPATRPGDAASAPPDRPLALERRQARNFSSEAETHIRDLQQLARTLIESREQEQHDLSRELHDNIAQVLAAATARITLAEEESLPAWLRQELLDLRDQLKAALEDIRHLARDLRPALLDHLGFTAALEKHADAFRERVTMTLDLRVDPQAVQLLQTGNLTHLFRLAQEALQNIEEHSGATAAWVDFAPRDGHLHLEIGDNGRGFAPSRVAEAQRDGHLGLLGMRERAELLGGNFLLEAVPDQGTTIRVTFPPPAKPAPESML